MKLSIVVCAVLLSLSCAVQAVNDVIVKDLRLFVNCEEFFMKAMCYSPTPLGRVSGTNTQAMGGLCSSRKNLFGEDLSACEDEDFWDGSSGDPNRIPPGPSNGWFDSIWERDFPVMKELGTRSIYGNQLL
jgi:hypothetical protein